MAVKEKLSVNENPSLKELQVMEEIVEKFIQTMFKMNEIIYVEYPDYDTEARPSANGHHATLTVKFKQNRFIASQVSYVADDFCTFTENFFKGFFIQWNANRTTFSIWYQKKGKF